MDSLPQLRVSQLKIQNVQGLGDNDVQSHAQL